MASPKQFAILASMGYTRNEIAEMTEEEAWDIISRGKGTTNGNETDASSHKDYVKTINRKNLQELDLEISENLNKICNDDVENSIIIDKNGNVFELKGDKNRVSLSEGVSLDGAISIHNHVVPHSFSKEDLMVVSENLGAEFYLTDTENVYWAKGLKKIDKPYNEFYVKALTLIQESEGDKEQPEHYIMEVLKKEGYVDYERYRKEN